MDYDFRRPRYRTQVAQPLAPALATNSGSAPTMHAISQGTAPQAVPATAQVVAAPVSEPKKLDFASGAKAYKRKVMTQSVTHALAICVYIMTGVAILLAAGGLYVNHKYANRALPFSYVGAISVGGLSEAEVKKALDYRISQLDITLTDGGLVRKVPLTRFAVTFDTGKVAYDATHRKFNPFAYLNQRRYDVPVTVNERQVDGYVTTTINSSKTASEDAKLIVDKKKLKIQPETQGFRTNSQFVYDRLLVALTTLSQPNINVNTVTLKPNVYATDLEDDLARANTLLNTDVALQYGKTVIKPKYEEKLAWLTVEARAGSDDVNLSFSPVLIRQYVVTQANKFQASTNTPTGVDSAQMIATTQKGTVIDNIDDATRGLVTALNSGKTINQPLTSKIGTYNKIITASTQQ